MIKTILTFVLAIVLASGAAFGQAILLKAPKAEAEPKKPDKPAAATPAAAAADKSIRLAPIVANLALPEGMWVRIDIVLVTSEQNRHDVDAMSPKVAQDILNYLQTMSVSDLEGVHSLAFLRQEFIERAAIRSENKIKDVLITTMVLQ